MMKLATFAAALITLASGAQLAAASPCKNINLVVKNSFIHNNAALQIKVIDFDYLDDDAGKWREEAVIGNVIVNPGQSELFVSGRTLSYVGDQTVQLRVQFKYLTQSNGWSDTFDAYSEPFFCSASRTIPQQITLEVK